MAVAALLTAQGCGLLFGERVDTDGTGAGTETTGTVSTTNSTGTGGSGGGNDKLTCEDVIVRDGDSWLHSFARATLFDLRIDGGTITFTGRANGGIKGGLPGLQGPGTHLFVAQVAGSGCDIAVQDLGTDFGDDDFVRLSQGSDDVLVVWTRGADLCAANFNSLDGPAEVGCPPSASIVCSIDQGVFSTPGIAQSGVGTLISYFREANGGIVTCNDDQDSAPVLGGTRLYSDDLGFQRFGQLVNHVRMATIATGEVLMTGHCPAQGNEPGPGTTTPQCGMAQPGYKLIGTLYGTDGSLAIAETTNVMQPNGSEATIVPSTRGVGYLHITNAQGQRRLGWGILPDVDPGYEVLPEGAPLILNAASAPGSKSAQVLAGQSHGNIGDRVICPNNPCVPYAFWLVDSSTGGTAYGRGYGTTESGETSANAAAISSDRIIVGGRFKNGQLVIDNLTSRTDADADDALFLANVPNVSPEQ